MPNPEISQITLPSGTTYDIKDAYAREAIASNIVYIGVTTTALTDGATTNPIMVNGESYNAKSGNLVVYDHKEFLFNGTSWAELGDLTGLGDLAYKDTASGSYTPQGTVSQPTFTGSSSAVTVTATDNADGNYQPKGSVSSSFSGSSMSSTGKFTPSGSVSVSTATTSNQSATVSPAASGAATYTPAGSISGSFTGSSSSVTVTAETDASGNYQPAGSVAAPTISVATAGSTTTVNSITAVGTLPSLTTTVTDEVLTIGWSAGTLPTKGADTTVKTGDASYSATAPAFTGTKVQLAGTVTPSGSISASFTGTGVRLETGSIAVPATYSASFTGSEGDVTTTGTPSGSVTSSFTGSKAQISGTVTPSGTVSQPTFSGTTATITVS